MEFIGNRRLKKGIVPQSMRTYLSIHKWMVCCSRGHGSRWPDESTRSWISPTRRRRRRRRRVVVVVVVVVAVVVDVDVAVVVEVGVAKKMHIGT